ncbi:SGNH/GDSL hydrolase family protein [Calidifontibacter sp. DB0510]|uniref:SGNH/GDSL hydrolase family protein n=1 Tax=Metallococcus carri TaxID=1656884 RepID=A0A967AZU4_9MICO|nr:SGNH/GDSL hydrolase family protein [Metallococcus carri]NHN56159.1 SGNH/GDSL hydrolase family protein [Metallococcus carri]NOP38790.1 SGNH/GDSL hydrolase family protein [Calidifontibacter sp. DB2511S]
MRRSPFRDLVATLAVLVLVSGLALGVPHWRTEHALRGAGRLVTGSSSAADPPGPASPSPSASRPPLRVVALGDSVPAGANCGCTAYPSLVATRLGAQQGRAPQLHNLAQNGLTSDQMVQQLADPATRSAVAASDLVIIEIGANDFDQNNAYDASCQPAASSDCYASDLGHLRQTINRILSIVTSLQTAPNARVVVLGYWNVFLDGDTGASEGPTYVSGSADLTGEVNAILTAAAGSHHVLYADAHSPFDGPDGAGDATPYLTPDGDHPNAAGHRLLAQAVLASLGAEAATV